MPIKTIDHSPWVFVFGSNTAGRHGKGAALTALRHYGAQPNVGEGHCKQSYALPTKDQALQPLDFVELKRNAETFKTYARCCPDLTFQLTRIGCGYAGFLDAHIAPLFSNAPSNVLLPRRWELMGQTEQTFRLIVAGSRTVNDFSALSDSLDSLLQEKMKTHRIEIISGGARGVDTMGEDYAKAHGFDCIRIPAAWNAFDKPAGHLRNEVMAWFSDAVCCFWDGNSTGTQSMINIARREQMPLRVIRF